MQLQNQAWLCASWMHGVVGEGPDKDPPLPLLSRMAHVFSKVTFVARSDRARRCRCTTATPVKRLTFHRSVNDTKDRVTALLDAGLSVRSRSGAWNMHCVSTAPYPASIIPAGRSQVAALRKELGRFFFHWTLDSEGRRLGPGAIARSERSATGSQAGHGCREHHGHL